MAIKTWGSILRTNILVIFKMNKLSTLVQLLESKKWGGGGKAVSFRYSFFCEPIAN